MTNPISPALERELISVLREEYSFYQSLYILLDKQRDLLKYEKDDHLLDVYAEIERCQLRIQESENRVAQIRQRHPQQFDLAAMNPEIKKLVNSIVTLVKKNIDIISENDGVVRDRHAKLQLELNELRGSSKVLQYLAVEHRTAQFIDGKR